jgi:hypothetical protein
MHELRKLLATTGMHCFSAMLCEYFCWLRVECDLFCALHSFVAVELKTNMGLI